MDEKNALLLDLGEVKEIVQLTFNGQNIGILWKKPFRVDIREFVKSGANQLDLDPAKPMRYFRFPGTPERITEIEGYLDGKAVGRVKWRASNLFGAYRRVKAIGAYECSFKLDEFPSGSYLAIALNGLHGVEGAYAAIRVNGRPVGAADRSVSYPCNQWEYAVRKRESNYTYYIPLQEEMIGAEIEAVVLVMKDGISEFRPEVWVTAYTIPFIRKELLLTR